MTRDLIGQRLGNYELVSKLGEGGFAQVYLGQHVRLSTQAAIKVLHADLSDEEINEFQDEAKTIANLKHPHIVPVLDFDVSNGIPFLVMDYCPHGTLAQRHAKGERVPLSTVVSYIKQVADALQYAHDQKIIHRDVKPLNMLIGPRGNILLSDFGIASTAHSTYSMRTHSMRTQNIAGTAPYMAPEQIKLHPCRQSDQYALAIVTYEWLAGKLPFVGTPEEIAIKHLAVEPPSLCQMFPNLSVSVEEVVFKALAKDPKERFATVQAFATALEQASQTKQSVRVSMPSNIAPSKLKLPPAPIAPASSVIPAPIQIEVDTPDAQPLPPMIAAGVEQSITQASAQSSLAMLSMPKQSSSPSSAAWHEGESTTQKAAMGPYIVAAMVAAVVTALLGLELGLVTVTIAEIAAISVITTAIAIMVTALSRAEETILLATILLATGLLATGLLATGLPTIGLSTIGLLTIGLSTTGLLTTKIAMLVIIAVLILLAVSGRTAVFVAAFLSIVMPIYIPGVTGVIRVGVTILAIAVGLISGVTAKYWVNRKSNH